MSYRIVFYGNTPAKSTNEGHAKEVEILELSKKFAKELEQHGLLDSSMNGTHIGSVHDLNAEEPQVFNPTH